MCLLNLGSTQETNRETLTETTLSFKGHLMWTSIARQSQESVTQQVEEEASDVVCRGQPASQEPCRLSGVNLRNVHVVHEKQHDKARWF